MCSKDDSSYLSVTNSGGVVVLFLCGGGLSM